MTIDSHQHFWSYNPEKHSWISEDMSVIRRDFTPSELHDIYVKNNVDGCVAVEADQTLRETEYLLELAELYEWIKGIVGWIDLKSSDTPALIEKYSAYPHFKGVRYVLQALPDGFMSDPQFIKGVSALHPYGLTYDILTTERQLDEVVHFVSKLPEMKLVIDHISKPNIKEESIEHWYAKMKTLSEYNHVHVKLSGMITEAHWDSWTTDDLKPYVDFCLENFGPKRLMFGSDWPVCLVAGSYTKVIQSLKTLISSLSADEQNDIMGNTAISFYNLRE